MDEQLEHALEGSRDHAAVHEEAAVSPADGEINEETVEPAEAEKPKEVNTNSPTEEAEKASAAGLSDTERDELPSPHGEGGPPSTAVDDERPQAPCKRATEQSEALSESQVSSPAGENVVPPRDRYAEWQELAEAHPEVVGKELPEDILEAVMQSDLPPLRVYESMMLQKQADQIAALQQEIATLRQNAENTARAPVVAAADGPANEPEERFIKDFWSY